jgi:hypothetical protein
MNRNFGMVSRTTGWGISRDPAQSRVGATRETRILRSKRSTNAEIAERVAAGFVVFFLGAVGGALLLLLCILGMILDSLIYS